MNSDLRRRVTILWSRYLTRALLKLAQLTYSSEREFIVR
jgi:hypothetical protein